MRRHEELLTFSVVTISFNQAEFLERTIESVISQEGVKIQYIIVDPGSTDGSREIIQRYSKYFAHIVFDKDRGPADGLNRGFSLATGDVCCYLNSDDTFEPNALARVAAILNDNVDCDVICGHAWVTDRNDNRLRRVWSEPYKRLSMAYGAAVQVQPSTFIRMGAFRKSGGFNVLNKNSWDGELLDELYLSGARFAVVNEMLSTYRLHSQSITNSGRLADLSKISSELRFKRLMGRPKHHVDNYVSLLMRGLKHVCSPTATWERITRGPVFNRGIE